MGFQPSGKIPWAGANSSQDLLQQVLSWAPSRSMVTRENTRGHLNLNFRFPMSSVSVEACPVSCCIFIRYNWQPHPGTVVGEVLGAGRKVRKLREGKSNQMWHRTPRGDGRHWRIIGAEPVWEQGRECLWVMCPWQVPSLQRLIWSQGKEAGVVFTSCFCCNQ